jgi:hypothetical protein
MAVIPRSTRSASKVSNLGIITLDEVKIWNIMNNYFLYINPDKNTDMINLVNLSKGNSKLIFTPSDPAWNGFKRKNIHLKRYSFVSWIS